MSTSSSSVSGAPQSLVGLLADLAAAAPDRRALSCGDDEITRGELERRTNRLARAYQQLGVTKDSLVTIGLPNGIEFISSAIAVWKCGATPQPISAKLPGRETAAIIELAAPTLAVGVEAHDAPGCPVVPAGYEPPQELAETAFDLGAASSLKAPTSGGSTGRPKLIVSTDPATAESVLPLAQLVGMREHDTVLITGPLCHNAPFTLAICGLALGGHVVVMPRFDATISLQLVESWSVTWMYAVPTMMSRIWRLTERESYDANSLRVVMHMAAPCPSWLKQAWIDWLGADSILELYAGTEIQAATVLTGSEWLSRPGTVGRPVFGEMIVLNSEGERLPSGEVGEVWMRRGEGASNPYRYIGAEAQSRDGGWETVGDMGWMDDDGYLYLADRKADMIHVGGANVYPAEIESALLEQPLVLSAVVIGLPDDDLGQVPHALVELEQDLGDDDLYSHLSDRIARYKIPRSFERVSEPLRDDAGKIRRSTLVAERVTPDN
ncbi:AMP-binding protein [Dietzia sp. KRD202]|uniref:AMP-binding protein n=1 Tax=Dietzia sp. KRD202 TaxID=2729732 RepID=UPI0019D1ED99|nr:AMP-binding protein [Dietzia sp. KRD202]